MSLQKDLDFRTLAEAFYLQTLDQLSRANLDEPSLLPNWSRKHVAVHMMHNAEGFMRLLHWARTGEETHMYPSRDARDQAIEMTSNTSKTVTSSPCHTRLPTNSPTTSESFPRTAGKPR